MAYCFPFLCRLLCLLNFLFDTLRFFHDAVSLCEHGIGLSRLGVCRSLNSSYICLIFPNLLHPNPVFCLDIFEILVDLCLLRAQHFLLLGETIELLLRLRLLTTSSGQSSLDLRVFGSCSQSFFVHFFGARTKLRWQELQVGEVGFHISEGLLRCNDLRSFSFDFGLGLAKSQLGLCLQLFANSLSFGIKLLKSLHLILCRFHLLLTLCDSLELFREKLVLRSRSAVEILDLALHCLLLRGHVLIVLLQLGVASCHLLVDTLLHGSQAILDVLTLRLQLCLQ